MGTWAQCGISEGVQLSRDDRVVLCGRGRGTLTDC